MFWLESSTFQNMEIWKWNGRPVDRFFGFPLGRIRTQNKTNNKTIESSTFQIFCYFPKSSKIQLEVWIFPCFGLNHRFYFWLLIETKKSIDCACVPYFEISIFKIWSKIFSFLFFFHNLK